MIAWFVLACSAGPWAETPLLAEKAVDPSFFAVASANRQLWRPFPDVRPNDRASRTDPSREWSWFGRNLTVLDPWDGDSSARAGVGNEVGDRLFRQTDGESVENRTPAIWGRVTTPRARGWRAGAFFDQVDHFSDRGLEHREASLGNPSISVVDPSVRRAWFGENLPEQSFAGGHLDGVFPSGRVGIAVSTGWAWVASPVAGELEAWRATTTAQSLRWRQMEWDQALGWFDRADTASGRLVRVQGRLGADLPMTSDSGRCLRAGIWYSRDGRSGNSAWRPDFVWNLGLWAHLDFEKGGWSVRGSHLMSPEFHRMEDTLRWKTRTEGFAFSVLGAGAWSDRPEGIGAGADSTRAGWARTDGESEEQAYLLRTEGSATRGHWTWEASTGPWAVVHPRAFEATGYDTTGGWIVRSGAERALPGTILGWKNRLGARVKGGDWFQADASVQFDPVLGGPRSRTDLVAPAWGASLGFAASHRSGFAVRPRILWRSSSTIRNRSPADWRIPSGFDANLWIDQSYFQGRLVFSCAALNMLSRDPIEAPNAAEDRFRILVQVAARPWD